MLRLAFILLPLCASGATAALDLDEPGRAFAHCEGRIAASVEFGWLFGDHDRDADRLRATFTQLEAAVPETNADGSRIRRDVRIRARADQKRLLSDARFATDERRRRIAAAEARSHMRRCEALLLG